MGSNPAARSVLPLSQNKIEFLLVVIIKADATCFQVHVMHDATILHKTGEHCTFFEVVVALLTVQFRRTMKLECEI